MEYPGQLVLYHECVFKELNREKLVFLRNYKIHVLTRNIYGEYMDRPRHVQVVFALFLIVKVQKCGKFACRYMHMVYM